MFEKSLSIGMTGGFGSKNKEVSRKSSAKRGQMDPAGVPVYWNMF